MAVQADGETSPSMRRAVLSVDVGGVLLHLNPSLVLPISARYGGIDSEPQFRRAAAAAHQSTFPSLAPRSSWATELPAHLRVPCRHHTSFMAEYEALCATRNPWDAPDHEAKADLREFVDAGFPVVIVSSADGYVERLLRSTQTCQVGPGPGIHVDAIFDSSVVGLDKPDPRFFLHALSAVDGDPARSVHVGDTVPADVRGAEAAGMIAVHLDPYELCDDVSGHVHVRRLRELRPYLG